MGKPAEPTREPANAQPSPLLVLICHVALGPGFAVLPCLPLLGIEDVPQGLLLAYLAGLVPAIIVGTGVCVFLIQTGRLRFIHSVLPALIAATVSRYMPIQFDPLLATSWHFGLFLVLSLWASFCVMLTVRFFTRQKNKAFLF